MTRLRVLIRILSDDAFELKAQALNNDSRLREAGIAALKFTSDKNYIVDGDFAGELPPQGPTRTSSDTANVEVPGNLHVFLRIPTDDSYELKAQALNNSPDLKRAGIRALRRAGDKLYISDGEFSEDVPPQAGQASSAEKTDTTTGAGKLHIFVRIPTDDSYELKAQALNNNPDLKQAGIKALRDVGAKLYISDGEFSEELPSQESTIPSPRKTSDTTDAGNLHVFVRLPTDDSYELKTQALNNNPDLKRAGIRALRRAGDKKYISEGEFASELPPPESTKKAKAAEDDILHVFVRIPTDDSYELKSQALNRDPRLKRGRVKALRRVGDKRYIVNGEFTTTVPMGPELEVPKRLTDEKLRLVIRMPSDDAYTLVSDHRNGDPRFPEAGISDVGLVPGQKPKDKVLSPPIPAKKKRRGCLVPGILLGLSAAILTTGIGLAYGFVPNFLPQLNIEPLSNLFTQIAPVSSSPTATPIPPTKATPAVSTPTSSPTSTQTATLTRTPTTTATLEFIFTAKNNVFCRTGPSTLFEGTEVVLAGTSVPIRGYTTSPIDNDAVWWLVYFDEEECYVSASAGTASVPLDEVTFLEPQPGTPSVQPTEVTFIEPPPFNSSITGTVYSYYYGTGYPYANETVELYGQDCSGAPLLYTATDSNGYYGFFNLPAGDYCVSAYTSRTLEPGGYVPELPVSVAESQNVVVDFPLSDP